MSNPTLSLKKRLSLLNIAVDQPTLNAGETIPYFYYDSEIDDKTQKLLIKLSPTVLIDPTTGKIYGGTNPQKVAIADATTPTYLASVKSTSNDFSTGGYALTTFSLMAYFNNSPSYYVERARTPNTWKSGTLGAAGDNAIWTPAAGKKFRLMGFVIYATGNTGVIKLTDNPAGTTIWTGTAAAALQFPTVNFPANGYISGAINQILEMNLANAINTNYTVWGTEE